MPGFEPSVPTALGTYLTPTAVAASRQYATAMLAEAQAGNTTISDHSIPGAALLQGLTSSRLSSTHSQVMQSGASINAKEADFIYSIEWQATQCSEPSTKKLPGNLMQLWQMQDQKARRIALRGKCLQATAARGLQILQERSASQKLQVTMPCNSSADGINQSSAASAALVKVAATEQAARSQVVRYVDVHSRGYSPGLKSGGDAFGAVSGAGVQLLPKLLVERRQSQDSGGLYSQDKANAAIISGGLGGG